MLENQMQREVLWPRLVANKLFHSSSGSNCFAADFHTNDSQASLLESSTEDRKEVHSVFASTWNIGGVAPSDDLNLEDWLDTSNNSYDIYVIGFQEIVPLTAKNILGAERKRISSKWNSLIRSTLNKSISNQQPMQNFRCIVSKQMVGIQVSVWIRGDLHHYIHHRNVSCTGCGIMGCLGNKGAVSVRFFLHETSFCIICCHLASGGREGDEMQRNSDAMEIFSRTSFPPGISHNLPQKIVDHDRVILLGDLNYRISLPEDKTRSLAEEKKWNLLLEKDQLQAQMSRGGTFEGWHEGKITFLPTYKYYPNSDDYYGCVDGRKGEKIRRAPAWCDRILWHGKGLNQVQYDRAESRLSDHRPVRAIFIAEIDLLKNSNSLESFFDLDDKLDCVASPVNSLFNDDISDVNSS